MESCETSPLTASMGHCEGDGEGMDESVKGVGDWAEPKQEKDLQAIVGMAMMVPVFTVVQFYFQVTWELEWRKLRVVLSQSWGFAWWVAWRGRGTKDWRFWRGNKSNNQSWDRTERWQKRSNRWREHEEIWEAQWGTEQARSVEDHLHFFLENLLPTPLCLAMCIMSCVSHPDSMWAHDKAWRSLYFILPPQWLDQGEHMTQTRPIRAIPRNFAISLLRNKLSLSARIVNQP